MSLDRIKSRVVVDEGGVITSDYEPTLAPVGVDEGEFELLQVPLCFVGVKHPFAIGVEFLDRACDKKANHCDQEKANEDQSKVKKRGVDTSAYGLGHARLPIFPQTIQQTLSSLAVRGV